MSTEHEAQGEQATPPPTSLIEKIQGRYRYSKDHLEKYPYVWASYGVVYGGFGLYLAYRWRTLRKTEDRVRALQERLRKLAEAKEEASRATSSAQKLSSSAASSSSTISSAQKPPSSADKIS